MIDIKNKVNCCGCGACEQVCPVKCIHMIGDKEGFLYPEVDQSSCIKCGLCERSCPILSVQESEIINDAYIAYSKDDRIRILSSSGGVFSVLSESVLGNHGTVFGAVFDRDFSVYHKKVDCLEGLSLIRGSKYLQSRIENSYKETKRLLDEGKTVLFSGTGCQIAGLKSFLKVGYENLLTVDILCHGTPSPKLWSLYIHEKELLFDSTVKNISFRKKNTGWRTYSLCIEFENGKSYSCVFNKDPYMKMFLRNICLRPSCYSCRFKAINSQADITLGDCWGIEKYMPELDDNKGCSLIITHTNKGNDLIRRVMDNLEIREADLSRVQQPMIINSAELHPNRKKFFRAVGKESKICQLEKMLKLSLFDRAKSFFYN